MSSPLSYLHLPRSTAPRRSPYIKLPSAFVTHETGTAKSDPEPAVEQSEDASTQPARAYDPATQQCRHDRLCGVVNQHQIGAVDSCRVSPAPSALTTRGEGCPLVTESGGRF